MFVESDEFAKRLRRKFGGEDGVRWAIALEDAMRNEQIGRAFGLDLLRRLPERERFGLRKDVCREYVMVVAKRIERLAKSDKVTGNETSPLMNQLIKGVLAVGSRFAPVNWA